MRKFKELLVTLGIVAAVSLVAFGGALFLTPHLGDKVSPAAVASAIVAMFALFLSIDVFVRGDVEAVRALHTDLTTGPVAQARHWLGAAVRGRVSDSEKAVEHWFALLWAIERARAVHERLDDSEFINVTAKHHFASLLAPQLALIDRDLLRAREAVDAAIAEDLDDETSLMQAVDLFAKVLSSPHCTRQAALAARAAIKQPPGAPQPLPAERRKRDGMLRRVGRTVCRCRSQSRTK